MKRRLFIQKSLLATTAFSLSCKSKTVLSQTDTFKAPTCSQTPQDQEGPYHREDMPLRSELHIYKEKATPFQLRGKILSDGCAPIVGAVLQVWHANATGSYDTESSEYRYYGQTTTDEEGSFLIKTIYPGAYLNRPPDIYRPRHFHIKILIDGRDKLTTQLYFDNDSYRSFESVSPDLILSVVEDTPFWHSKYDFTIS